MPQEGKDVTPRRCLEINKSARPDTEPEQLLKRIDANMRDSGAKRTSRYHFNIKN